jgi:chorismate lyase
MDAARPGWYSLNVIWKGDGHDVQRGLPHSQLSPAWQVLILGDG